MADKHEEAARKTALAAKYADIARKREEKLKNSLSHAQYDFFRNQGLSVDQTIYSNLVTAMRDPNTVPSEYVSKKLGWLFDLAIPSREKDVILYFADFCICHIRFRNGEFTPAFLSAFSPPYL